MEKHSDWPVEENEDDGQTIGGNQWRVLEQAGWRGNDTRLRFFKVSFFSTLGLFVGGFHIITLSHRFCQLHNDVDKKSLDVFVDIRATRPVFHLCV